MHKFFFPLAIYLLILALINSRRRPTMISGPWDFALVLLALSGFILVGGPSILAQFDIFWRYLLLHARFRTFLRVSYYVPYVTSWVAVALVWSWLFDRDYGLINLALHFFGISGPAWLSDPRWALPA